MSLSEYTDSLSQQVGETTDQHTRRLTLLQIKAGILPSIEDPECDENGVIYATEPIK